jgi:regulator of PEP synthase PpsR (kinase-PPPase family)
VKSIEVSVKEGAMFHIYAVSDGTGKTAEGVVRAALTQFDDSQVNIKRYGGVRSTEQVCEIVEEANQTGGFIVHTMVSEKMRRLMFTEGRAANVATIDLMGPMLARLTDLMATQPRAEPGLFVPFDQAYLLRIDAIDYTVRHDDGRNVDDLESAEIVLVGVSRTSKTPLSIYLAYRGWRVANVPIVLGVDPPPLLFYLPKRRVVGLIVKPARLVELRHVRVKHMGVSPMGYADLEYIKQEVAYAYELFEKRRDWPLVDVTTKPIEETAAEVVALVGKREQGVL